jgi:hypothetical protein
MHKYLIAVLPLALFAACGKGGNDNAKPSVTSLPVTNITTTGATSGCDITSKGGSSITDAGIMWDTTGKFTTAHDSSNYSSALNFTVTIPGLLPGTTWYVRAYATNNAGTTYGNTLQFTTDTIPSDYTVTTVAGNGKQGLANGPALSASFFDPLGVAVVPNGILYIADGTAVAGGVGGTGYIRQIGTDGTVSILATVGRSASDVAVDASGNIYDLDINDTLYKITPAGVVTPLAAGLGIPIAMDIDNAGNIYATFGKSIGIITPAGMITKLPVTASTGFIGIAVDRLSHSMYVSDGPILKKIDTLGNTTFIAGGNGTADGTGSAAGFGTGPLSEIKIDKNGNLFATEPYEHKVRMITPAGVVTTIAGNGTAGDVDGSASRANFNDPIGLAIDSNGNIFVTDVGTHKIKKIAHK